MKLIRRLFMFSFLTLFLLPSCGGDKDELICLTPSEYSALNITIHGLRDSLSICKNDATEIIEEIRKSTIKINKLKNELKDVQDKRTDITNYTTTDSSMSNSIPRQLRDLTGRSQ